jgi:hypothetical protein
MQSMNLHRSLIAQSNLNHKEEEEEEEEKKTILFLSFLVVL